MVIDFQCTPFCRAIGRFNCFNSNVYVSSSDLLCRKMCQMLVPIALLLAAQAADDRLSVKVRDSSEASLRALSTQFSVTLGLYTDLSTEVAIFLWHFDEGWHDPALAKQQVHRFCTRSGHLVASLSYVCIHRLRSLCKPRLRAYNEMFGPWSAALQPVLQG